MIERSEHLRADASAMEATLRDAASRFVVYDASDVLLRPSPPIAPAGVPACDLGKLGVDVRESVFLGLEERVPWFAVDIGSGPEPARSLLEPLGRFAALGSIQDPVDGEAWSLLSQARALLAWNARSHYCPACGAPAVMRNAGYMRACTDPACGAQHFPRSDPAIIVRVTHRDRCLLARQPSFRPGLHSILAGFVEPGESLEDAVRREVEEEAGLQLGAVSYVDSQPWPFPTSLMVGFAAEATGDDIHIDSREIESAGWMTRAEVHAEMQSGTLLLPSLKSIARRLIDEWLNDG
jgi:NAD+ diphosphatase